MSDTAPTEEAPIYRGDTLTPESPRPLHVPSPAGILVLENQIDPIFNLMSTHTEPRPHTPPPQAGQESEPVNTSEGAATANVTELNTTAAQSGLSEQPKTAAVAQADHADPTAISATDGLSTNIAQDTAHMISQMAASTSPSTGVIVNDEATTIATAPPADPASTAHTEDQSSSKASPAQSEVTPAASINAVQQSLQNMPHDHVQALIQSLQIPMQHVLTSPQQSGLSQPDITSAIAPSATAVSPAVNTSNAEPQIPSSGLPPRPATLEQTASLPAAHPLDTAQYNAGNATLTSNLATLPQAAAESSNALGQIALPNTPNFQTGAPAPDTEAAWRTFVDEESVFTAEGAWEKFPHGSRLFVGNLPTESVNRRDIFDIFHKYGKLAQIAIKQAYGFVQFMDVQSCQKAMKAEQGSRIKERNMHLEVSKPPKSSRGKNNNSNNNEASAAGDRIRERNRRDRSRSPHRRNRGSRGGGGTSANNSVDMRYSDYRDDRRGRDDYRPGRSPSPRRNDGYRPRDRSPDRHYDGRRRSRSPNGRNGHGRRSASPRRSGLDDDHLPLPRRAPRDVPDVQIILVEDVSRPFIEFVVGGFTSKSVRCDVLNMPRVPLEAVIRRQIVEGVIAVCTLTRQEERTGKVSLQIFDRSRGTHDVRFEEYDDLTMPIAAELAARAKAQNPPPAPVPGYGAGPYVAPYMQQQQQQQQQQQRPDQPQLPPNIQSLIGSLDPASVQQLLSVVQQQQQQQPQGSHSQQSPTAPAFPGHDMNAHMGAGMTPQQPSAHMQGSPGGYPYQQQAMQHPQQPQQQQQAYGYRAPGYPPSHAVPMTGAPAPPQYGQPATASSNNVQSIMDQLATIQRQG